MIILSPHFHVFQIRTNNLSQTHTQHTTTHTQHTTTHTQTLQTNATQWLSGKQDCTPNNCEKMESSIRHMPSLTRNHPLFLFSLLTRSLSLLISVSNSILSLKHSHQLPSSLYVYTFLYVYYHSFIFPPLSRTHTYNRKPL